MLCQKQLSAPVKTFLLHNTAPAFPVKDGDLAPCTLHLAQNLHASWDPLIVQTQQCLGLVSADARQHGAADAGQHGAAANQQQLHRHHSTLLTFWGCSANTSLDRKKEKIHYVIFNWKYTSFGTCFYSS